MLQVAAGGTQPPLRAEPGRRARRLADRRGLEQLYRRYWRGTGMFFAKHLHQPRRASVLRLFALSVFRIFRGTVRRVVKRRARARSTPRGLGREFVAGLVGSWRLFDD